VLSVLPEIKGGSDGFNKLLREFNEYVREWDKISNPVKKARDNALKACTIDVKKDASFKEAIVGTILSYML